MLKKGKNALQALAALQRQKVQKTLILTFFEKSALRFSKVVIFTVWDLKMLLKTIYFHQSAKNDVFCSWIAQNIRISENLKNWPKKGKNVQFPYSKFQMSITFFLLAQ